MSWNLARKQLRTGMLGAAALLVGATVYWVSRPGQHIASTDERLAAIASSATAADAQRLRETALADSVSTLPRAAAPAADPEESTIAEYTAEKYQFLLEDLRYLQASQVEQLHRALAARERLDGEMNAARQADDGVASDNLSRRQEALAQAENQIRGMLHPSDYATYEMLRESDLELFKLNDYAAGVGNVAPLSADDRKSIMKTKLAYKQRFRQLLEDSGLQRQDSSPAEREYAYAVAARALDDFKRSYLQEVRQYLSNDEQYALLSNYETTEFQAELAQLRSTVNPTREGS